MQRESGRPVTLDDLMRDGKLLWGFCRACGHERELEPSSLPLPGSTPVPAVGAHVRCSQCGEKKVHAAPQLYDVPIAEMRARRE